MAQVPTSERTYSRLSVLKAKGVIEKKGSVTWENVISALCDVADKHKDDYLKYVVLKQGKTRTMEVNIMSKVKKELKSTLEVKEALDKGDPVTSEQLEKVNSPKRLVE